MDHDDLQREYAQAADGAALQAVAWDTHELQERRFKLESLVTWARVRLQDAGFHTAQIASEEAPLVYLHASKQGRSGIFKLTYAQAGTSPEGQPLYGKGIIVMDNKSSSVTQLDLYDHKGSIPSDRFEILSSEIAKHVARTCGKQVSLQSTDKAPVAGA